MELVRRVLVAHVAVFENFLRLVVGSNLDGWPNFCSELTVLMGFEDSLNLLTRVTQSEMH